MDDLLQVALLAYRNKRYRDAVELLLQVVDALPSNWLARLYLGMSYQRVDRLADAQRLFRTMNDECLDAELRAKAAAALHQVENELKNRFAGGTSKDGEKDVSSAKVANG